MDTSTSQPAGVTTSAPRTIADFYGSYADWYDAICADRDFDAQVSTLLGIFAPDEPLARTLELFAGPAYHSGVLRHVHRLDAYAIDASPEMRHVAVGRGRCDPDHYIVGTIPDALERLARPFDFAFAPRYSFGYLSRPHVRSTLAALARLLRPGGVLAVELHRVPLIVRGLDRLQIRSREARRGRTLARCWWPNSPIVWSETDWKACMDVRVVWEDDAGNVLDECSFVSEEHVYSRDEFVDLALATGCFTPSTTHIAHEAVFPGATVAVVRRSDRV
jgi:SAM-dependent methyltransferase